MQGLFSFIVVQIYGMEIFRRWRKKNDLRLRRRSNCQKKLAFLNGLSGALIGAGAAGDADIGIDLVLAVAFGNCLNRALLSAGAAGNTSVSNDVSHGFTSILFIEFVRYVHNVSSL